MRKFIAILFIATAASAQSPDAIRAHMRFLASDELEGRGTGTRGYAVAAEYVAAQLRAYGLEAQMQPIRFRTTVRDTASTMSIQRDGAQPEQWTLGKEFVTYGDVLRDDTTASGRVVFAGYGVTAPDRGYDDYKDIDAKGKIVALFSGAPGTFPSEIRAHHSASLTKMENAVAHGAIGTIVILNPYDAHIPWSMLIGRSEQSSMNWVEADGTPHAARPEILASATLSHDGAVALLTGSKYSLDDLYTQANNGTLRTFELPLRATIHLLSHHGEVTSSNVIGILRGSDPKRRDEYLVYSAHLDHLGITKPVNGDAINNGALDNASGIGAMLEVARMLA